MGINRGTVLNLINDVHREGGFKDYNSYSYLFDQVDTMPESKEDFEPHWIPVTERLPKEDGDYLVTFEEGYAEDYGFDPIGIAPFEVDCEGFGIWQEHFDRQTLGSLGSDWVEIKVIAWMPLPEPAKLEND